MEAFGPSHDDSSDNFFASQACALNLIRSHCSQSSYCTWSTFSMSSRQGGCDVCMHEVVQHCQNVQFGNTWVVMFAWDVVPWLH